MPMGRLRPVTDTILRPRPSKLSSHVAHSRPCDAVYDGDDYGMRPEVARNG